MYYHPPKTNMTGWNIHHFEYFRKTFSFMFVFAIVNVSFPGGGYLSMEQPCPTTTPAVVCRPRTSRKSNPPQRSEGAWKSLKLAFFLLKQHKKIMVFVWEQNMWKNMEKVTPKFSEFQRNLRKNPMKKTSRKITGSQRNEPSIARRHPAWASSPQLLATWWDDRYGMLMKCQAWVKVHSALMCFVS